MAEKGGEKRETVAGREERVLRFWRENNIFEKSEGRGEKKLFTANNTETHPEKTIYYVRRPAIRDGTAAFRQHFGEHRKRCGAAV